MDDLVEIPDVLVQLEARKIPTYPIVGFALSLNPDDSVAADGPSAALSMLRDFASPIGDVIVKGCQTLVQWGAALPRGDQVLSTWSHHSDQTGSCFIEGDFYSEAWGHWPRTGGDPHLAQLTLDRVLSGGPAEIDNLNGLFSGFVFSAAEGRLWIFVDRLGARLLFYRRGESGRWYVASDLYGLRHAPGRLEVDPLSLNEHLAFGSPLQGKTIFRDVRIVQPGQVVQLTPGLARESRYYEFPERRPGSLAMTSKTLCDAMDEHVQSLCNRMPDGVGAAISSGHDSRVVLAALLRGGIQPKGLVFRTSPNDPDSSDALRLLAALKLPARVVSYAQSWSPCKFDWDSSILSLGYAPSWGFLILAALAALEGRLLLTGFSGDALSGSTGGIRPWSLKSPEALALRVLEAQGFAVPPSLATSWLRRDFRVPERETLSSWKETFRPPWSPSSDLLSAYISQRLAHRNRWRPGLIFHSMRVLSAPVHPFADRRVMDAYLALPIASLRGQAAHIAASLRGPSPLGTVPSNRFPLSLRNELRVLGLMEPLHAAYRHLARFRGSRKGSLADIHTFSSRQRQLLAVIMESSLFDSVAVSEQIQNRRFAPTTLTKLAATAIHAAFAMDQPLPSAPPPVFLTVAGASVV
jgi:hypothetical protein